MCLTILWTLGVIGLIIEKKLSQVGKQLYVLLTVQFQHNPSKTVYSRCSLYLLIPCFPIILTMFSKLLFLQLHRTKHGRIVICFLHPNGAQYFKWLYARTEKIFLRPKRKAFKKLKTQEFQNVTESLTVNMFSFVRHDI